MIPIPEFDTKVFTIKRTIDRDMYEHEVYLSFVNDDDAVAFEQWLRQEGAEAFLGWKADEYGL